MRYFGDCSPDNWLFRPLDNVPNRIVLDANALIDMTLIVDGLGAFVVNGLHKRGFELFTSMVAIEEVKRTLRRGRENLGDLSFLVDAAIAKYDIKVNLHTTKIPGISDHDNHLASVANENSSVILSEDLPLLFDLNKSSMHGRSLREVANWLLSPNLPSQDLNIFGQGFGADGHIFLKVIPALDMQSDSVRSWYLFDAASFGSLRYDGAQRCLIFESSVGEEISLALEIVPERQYSILLNYSVGRRTDLTIKVKRFDCSRELIKNAKFAPLSGRPTGKMTILNSRRKNAGWSGSLQSLTFGSYQLNKKVWRASISLVGVAPPTLTADLAFSAAILTEIKGEQVRRPLRQHVLELVNFGIPGFYPGRGAVEREAKWFE